MRIDPCPLPTTLRTRNPRRTVGLILALALLSSLGVGPAAPVTVTASEAASPAWRLWYEQPAAAWNESLPVGNGRLGASVFGTVARERILLNEETLWSGGPYDPSRDGGAEALARANRRATASCCPTEAGSGRGSRGRPH